MIYFGYSVGCILAIVYDIFWLYCKGSLGYAVGFSLGIWYIYFGYKVEFIFVIW